VRTNTAFSEQRFLHPPRGFNRQLELRPHNGIHAAIGTPEGMGGTPLAARDPIFWMHHTAVDRLWESWRQPRADGTSARDPVEPASWRARSFAFADAQGNRIEMTAEDVLRASTRLNYRYDRLLPVTVSAGMAIVADRDDEQPVAAQLSASSGAAVVLSKKDQRVTLDLQPSATTSTSLNFDLNPDASYYLVINVEVSQAPGALYEVYVSAPSAPGVAQTQELKVDTFSLFAVNHNRAGGGHSASGGGPFKDQWRADVTALVRSGRIDPKLPAKVSVKVIYADPASEVRVTNVSIEAE